MNPSSQTTIRAAGHFPLALVRLVLDYLSKADDASAVHYLHRRGVGRGWLSRFPNGYGVEVGANGHVLSSDKAEASVEALTDLARLRSDLGDRIGYRVVPAGPMVKIEIFITNPKKKAGKRKLPELVQQTDTSAPSGGDIA
jgi:hypothetical protein